MDTHDEPDDVELPGGDEHGEGPPGHDQLEPIRDLLDPDGPLGPGPSDRGGPEPLEDIPDIGPIIEELDPVPTTEPDPIDVPGPDSELDPYRPGEAAEPPVSLEVDSPSEVAPADPAQSEPGPVDLSLDGDFELEDAQDPAEPALGDVELPMPPAPASDYAVSERNSFISEGVLAAALVAIGASSASLVRRAKRSTPPDLAAHLDALGIDARVEHLDLVGLEELLARGGTVLLSTDGSAGVDEAAVVQVERIDRQAGRLALLAGDGSQRSVDLEHFEPAWADTANQVVLAAGPTGEVALVPVVLSPADVTMAR